MEQRLHISEERIDDGGKLLWDGHSNDHDLQVEYREANLEQDLAQICAILWQFWKEVNQEDLSDSIDVDVHGVKVPMTRIEMQVYQYLKEGCIIKVAELSGRIIGVLVGNILFKKIFAVRALYLDENKRDRKIGSELVKSVGKMERLIFQTRKGNPPEQMFKHISAVKKFEDDLLITWEMPGV